ncbi:hypothetical protein PIB30_046865 [Stylosanthes scabra]|uniref:Uncharacterized protein n=1 Tax=Stylosanthes scabra TaxID=79078 RepID=A0ABU6YH36_9FABA|nr:hypothetical protein [Stylosanthes scabra]
MDLMGYSGSPNTLDLRIEAAVRTLKRQVSSTIPMARQRRYMWQPRILLTLPSGFLHQACIKSHPNSSHPLHCRALNLCFSVTLERLPTSQSTNLSSEPTISNALTDTHRRTSVEATRSSSISSSYPSSTT